MFLKRPRHKQFEYRPRYYDPAKDEERRRGKRIQFHSNVRRGKRPSILFLGIMLALAVLLYFTIVR